MIGLPTDTRTAETHSRGEEGRLRCTVKEETTDEQNREKPRLCGSLCKCAVPTQPSTSTELQRCNKMTDA